MSELGEQLSEIVYDLKYDSELTESNRAKLRAAHERLRRQAALQSKQRRGEYEDRRIADQSLLLERKKKIELLKMQGLVNKYLEIEDGSVYLVKDVDARRRCLIVERFDFKKKGLLGTKGEWVSSGTVEYLSFDDVDLED